MTTMSDPTKVAALGAVEGLCQTFKAFEGDLGSDTLERARERLRTIQHYVNTSSPTQTHHYNELAEACGGPINPETLTDLFDNRFDQVTWEVRAQYYEFMAGMTRMMRPVGEE